MLIGASLLVYLMPILAIACDRRCCSRRHAQQRRGGRRHADVSLLMQLIGILPGLSACSPYLLTTQFNAWQGLLREPIDWAPIVRGAWVCAAYACRPCGRVPRLPAPRRRRGLIGQAGIGGLRPRGGA